MGMLYQICKHGAWVYYKLFYKMEVEGLDTLDTSVNYIVCANHINLQDPIVIGALLPFEGRFMAKKELFKNRIVASFLSKIGVFPVDRDANDLTAIKKALSILKNGESLGIFPEGTRNKGKTPLPVKSGVAMLAVKTQTLILPITLDSPYKLFGRLRVVFHPPVSFESYYGQKVASAELEKMSEQIMKSIYNDMKYYGQLLDK